MRLGVSLAQVGRREARDVALQGSGRRIGRVVTPQRLDDRFGRHHAATRDQEHGEHCARLATAHIHLCAVDDHLEAAQQPEFHALLPSDARRVA